MSGDREAIPGQEESVAWKEAGLERVEVAAGSASTTLTPIPWSGKSDMGLYDSVPSQ